MENPISDFQVAPDGNIYWAYKTDYAALLYPVTGTGPMFTYIGTDLIVDEMPPVLIVGKSIIETPTNTKGEKHDVRVRLIKPFSFDHILN